SQLLAALDMLPCGICVSPDGDLLVSVHSGKPDWGSGPTGKGKIYKISYKGGGSPQPVAVWPSSPTETRIEFDDPIKASRIKNLATELTVTAGKYVSAGDQYETIRPGYRAVQNQLLAPRYVVKVLSTELAGGGRSLIVRTEPRDEALNYALSLPRRDSFIEKGALRQEPTTELAYSLTGAEAQWQDPAGGERVSIWLPHLDLAVDRALTGASAAHQEFWAAAAKPGVLKLRAQLDLWQMLRAATQPDSTLDFKYPDETVTVVLKSDVGLQATAEGMRAERVSEDETRLRAVPGAGHWFPIEVALDNTRGGKPTLEVSWFTAEDSRPRALPLRRIFLPWARGQTSRGEKTERTIPEIAGGNWLRGEKLFFGDQASCYKCHTLGGRGGKVGPDLSNLAQRDYASVMKDITEPSAAVNPDHVAYNVQLRNDESLTGVLVGETAAESRFANAAAQITVVKKSEILSMKPSSVSLMPEGLLNALDATQRKDLLTFLLMTPPLQPAPIQREGEPPPRASSEVNAILNAVSVTNAGASGGAQASAPLGGSGAKPLRIILCDGPKDHGVNEHDYPLWKKRWSKLFALAENVSVEQAGGWPSAEQFKTADVIVIYSDNSGWSAERGKMLDQFLDRGGGLVCLHFAIDGHKDCPALANRIGLAWQPGSSKFRHGPIQLTFQPSPITTGFASTRFVDESYWNLIGNEDDAQVLATGVEDGKARPLVWTREQGKGRVFVSVPGHFT
ncbi:MAG TPA: ThuA domain-containing protein, partial [Verrucomicrobiae bacterium]|nr:ThuA domain-containing protein [Verrucomicrobiae bacterium]